MEFPFLKNSGVGGIIYNKDIFEKYGIAIPESEEDFYNVCERLKSLGILQFYCVLITGFHRYG